MSQRSKADSTVYVVYNWDKNDPDDGFKWHSMHLDLGGAIGSAMRASAQVPAKFSGVWVRRVDVTVGGFGESVAQFDCDCSLAFHEEEEE